MRFLSCCGCVSNPSIGGTRKTVVALPLPRPLQVEVSRPRASAYSPSFPLVEGFVCCTWHRQELILLVLLLLRTCRTHAETGLANGTRYQHENGVSEPQGKWVQASIEACSDLDLCVYIHPRKWDDVGNWNPQHRW